MTGFKQGDVILVPYPFGERAGGKKRPALVVSASEHNQATGELVWAASVGTVVFFSMIVWKYPPAIIMPRL